MLQHFTKIWTQFYAQTFTNIWTQFYAHTFYKYLDIYILLIFIFLLHCFFFSDCLLSGTALKLAGMLVSFNKNLS